MSVDILSMANLDHFDDKHVIEDLTENAIATYA